MCSIPGHLLTAAKKESTIAPVVLSYRLLDTNDVGTETINIAVREHNL
jgi:hypothetical protein